MQGLFLRAPLVGDPGVGKTKALQHLCHAVNPHEYQIIYHSDTDFGRVDLYRQLAIDLGLEPAYRRANVWRDIKSRIREMTSAQQQLPVWIIDEAQNLPADFFRDFPSFLNFTFDSHALISVWLVGHKSLLELLKRNAYAALYSRIQLVTELEAIESSETYQNMLGSVFGAAGASGQLISHSGMEVLRLASKGLMRQTGQIIRVAIQLAAQEKLNHLPDEIIKQAIKELKR